MKYFDYAATSPMSEDALSAFMKAAREYYGNTSSVHDVGTNAKALVEHSRQTLAATLNVDPAGLYFSSGGTEGNWLGIEALLSAGSGNHIIISAAEHSSVRRIVEKKEKEGWRISRIPLTTSGVVDVEALQDEMTEDTALVSVQLVNSDLGTIQPLEVIHRLCAESGVFLHSDFVQAFGKIDVTNVVGLVDSFSLSAHKIGGPKGVGAVYIRPSLSFTPIFPSVTHESGVRPGTLNTPGIASFVVAADHHVEEERISYLKSIFLTKLESSFQLVGDTRDQEVPILGLLVEGVPGQWLMLEGSRRGYAFSVGSACQSYQDSTLPTLDAMGIDEELAETFIRISFHPSHTEADVLGLADCLNGIVAEYSTVSAAP
ncbi:cysteine desulfurase family protein [Halobacillus salinus]|nr:IscS subfamily cysteine desulfurase [Halobacillus salinus]